VYPNLASPLSQLPYAESVSAQGSDSFQNKAQIIVSSYEWNNQKQEHQNPMHALDNVIWQALTTRQARFSQASGSARKFLSDVGPLSAFEDGEADGFASLATLLGDQDVGVLFLEHPYEARQGWEWIAGATLVQMVSETATEAVTRSNGEYEPVELGFCDSPEMIELTHLTKPGPFQRRTHELGTYLGIRNRSKLVAMAGERLKVPGFTEVSAVCTHPDYLGRGYARTLMLEVMRRIRDRDETPFLHVRGDNERALALYESLGFRTRWMGYFAVLKKTKRDVCDNVSFESA
jgi:ribosomal protein S18 acetylase RimI-like enzyme